jgi:hypothetical protein
LYRAGGTSCQSYDEELYKPRLQISWHTQHFQLLYDSETFYDMEEGMVKEIWSTSFQTSLLQRFESGLLISDVDTQLLAQSIS